MITVWVRKIAYAAIGGAVAMSIVVIAPAPAQAAGQPVAAPAAAAQGVAGTFVPLTPKRILDTRNGTGAAKGAVASGGILALTVTGNAGVPDANVSAVVLNVTVTQPQSSGFIAVYPAGSPPPGVSNLNFAPGQDVPNLVIAQVGAGGVVDLFNGSNGGTTQLIADVSGYYVGGTPAAAGSYVPLDPHRILDTRSGTGAPKAPVASGGTVSLPVIPAGGPANVSAVVINVTVTDPKTGGFISVYPYGKPAPNVSNLNYVAGQTVPNLVVVPVGELGQVTLLNGSNGGTTQLIADIAGYYIGGTPTGAGAFVPVTPTRIFDTRHGTGGTWSGPVDTGRSIYVKVNDVADVPVGASAVVVNVTVTQPTTAGFIAAYPSALGPPTVSNVNFTANQDVPNLAIVPVGAAGQIRLLNGSNGGTTHLIADISGYYLAPKSAQTWAPAKKIDPLQDHPSGVSCPTASFCLAVDTYGNYQTYNGATWSAPVSFADEAIGVSCVSATFCVSVSNRGVASIFNGETWSSSAIDQGAGLTAVSCVSTAFCMAVGAEGQAFKYNGVSWSGPVTITLNQLPVSVSCVSTAFCMAVDSGGNAITYTGSWLPRQSVDPDTWGIGQVSCSSATLCRFGDGNGQLYTFNGTTWSAPSRITNNAVGSLSCPTTTFCAADAGGGQAVVFNGAGWSAPVTVADTTSFTASFVVSCSSPSFCAGLDATGGAFTYNGTAWSSRTVVDKSQNPLISVSCPSSTFCAAVDSTGNAFTYDGSTWSPRVDLATPYYVSAVSCASSTFCVAVSAAGEASRFNGTTWSAFTSVTASSPGGLNTSLRSVSCTSSTFCAATVVNGDVAMFNGASWSVTPGVGIYLVSCVSNTFCLGAGSSATATFNGTTWAMGPSFPRDADPQDSDGVLALSCVSSSFCMGLASGSAATFDGTSWSTPSAIADVDRVAAVSCPTSASCTAADLGTGYTFTWDGSAWSAAVDADTQPTGRNYPVSISCPTTSFCMLVDQVGNAMRTS